MVTRVVVAALVVVALAGCAKQVGTEGQLASIDGFDGFTWAGDEALGPGALLDPAPRFVQQLAPYTSVTQASYWDPLDILQLTTMPPPVAVDNAGGVYTITVDEVLKSVDGGKNWTIVLDFLRFQDAQAYDRWETTAHALWYHGASDTMYALFANLNGCEVLFSSQDGGTTWQTRGPSDWPTSCADAQDVWVGGTRITLRPRMLGGPRADDLPLPGDHALYICEESQVGIKCGMSVDGGQLFPYQALAAPPVDGCQTLTFGHGGVRADGAVALPLGTYRLAGAGNILGTGVLPDCANRPPSVAYSTDGGFSWQTAMAPAGVQAGNYPALAFSADGTAYLAYRSGEQAIQVVRSSDLFQTWDGPFNVTLPGHVMGEHPAITAGADGRVAVSYLATSTIQVRSQGEGALPPSPDRAETGTIWHRYVATSHDADSDEPTWHVQRVTPSQDPIQMGCIASYAYLDYASYNYACYNLGLWSQMTSGPDGRAYVAFLDGCTPRNGCTADVAGGYSFRDRQVSVATLDAGLGLEGDVLASLGLQHPAPQREAEDVYTG